MPLLEYCPARRENVTHDLQVWWRRLLCEADARRH
jgi:hypothetical protein